MARMRHKMRQKRAKTPAAKHRRVRGGQQTRLDATGQGHIDPVDRVLMSKKQLGKRRSNPHANISLSNKKRKKLLKLMAHQQRDELRKKGLPEAAENLETSLLFGNEDDEEETTTTTDHQSGEISTNVDANDDEDAEMKEI